MKRLLLIFEILTIFETLSFSLGITLTLKSSAIVSSNFVTLYDLAATFTGVSTQTLKNFTIAFAPQPGTYYDLDAQSVKIMAERSIKWLKVIPTSQKIKISTISIPINLSILQNAISTAMGTSSVFIIDFQPAGIQSTNYSIKIESISKIGDKYFALVKIVDGNDVNYSNATFEVGSIGSTESMEGIAQIAAGYLGEGITLSRVTDLNQKLDLVNVGKPFKLSNNMVGVPVNFIDGGILVDSRVIKYIPHEFVNVIIAAKNIYCGQKITSDMLSQKYVDVYATTTVFATSISRITGSMATWSFSIGQIVSLQGVQTPPDVLAGQILVAYVSYPSMTVTTFVRAMQDGRIGQIISVRNVENGYMMYGLIEKGPRIRIYTGG